MLFHFIIVNNPFHNYPGFVLQAKSAIFTAKCPARAYTECSSMAAAADFPVENHLHFSWNKNPNWDKEVQFQYVTVKTKDNFSRKAT